MGNRAVITTKENLETGRGLEVYLHWNGGRDSVEGFLEYCRLRSFRPPEKDDYGWARLCQVIGNFLGADGCSVGVDEISRLDTDNGDNGTYLIRDWEIVGRKYFSGKEQYGYGIWEFLDYLDESQPEQQRLGSQMMRCLMHHGKVISDINWNYQFEMAKRREEGIGCTGFKEGSYYSLDGNRPYRILRILDRPEMEAVVEMDGKEMTLPRFVWRDGTESILVKDENGTERSVTSMNEVSS